MYVVDMKATAIKLYKKVLEPTLQEHVSAGIMDLFSGSMQHWPDHTIMELCKLHKITPELMEVQDPDKPLRNSYNVKSRLLSFMKNNTSKDKTYSFNELAQLTKMIPNTTYQYLHRCARQGIPIKWIAVINGDNQYYWDQTNDYMLSTESFNIDDVEENND